MSGNDGMTHRFFFVFQKMRRLISRALDSAESGHEDNGNDKANHSIDLPIQPLTPNQINKENDGPVGTSAPLTSNVGDDDHSQSPHVDHENSFENSLTPELDCSGPSNKTVRNSKTPWTRKWKNNK